MSPHPPASNAWRWEGGGAASPHPTPQPLASALNLFLLPQIPSSHPSLSSRSLVPRGLLGPVDRGGGVESMVRGLYRTALPAPISAQPLWTPEKVPWGPEGGEG